MTEEVMTVDAVPTDTRIAPEHRSRWQQGLRGLMRNRGAMFGAAILLVLILVAVFAPVLAPYDPLKISLYDMLQSPNWEHPMGTDGHGRDLLSRVIFGSRISLQLGMISVVIAAFWGTILGVIAGYYGGWADQVAMRAVDVMLAFPGILLAMCVVAILGPGLTNVMIAVGIAWIPSYARLMRGSTLVAKENEYVQAARCVGCSSLRIVFRHILPNTIAPLIVLSTMNIGTAIIAGSSLSFLGLGAQPPQAEWGAILNSGRPYIRIAWWVMTFPGLAILITVMAANLLGDGLRVALDPRI